jgi:hypothetical protein
MSTKALRSRAGGETRAQPLELFFVHALGFGKGQRPPGLRKVEVGPQPVACHAERVANGRRRARRRFPGYAEVEGAGNRPGLTDGKAEIEYVA